MTVVSPAVCGKIFQVKVTWTEYSPEPSLTWARCHRPAGHEINGGGEGHDGLLLSEQEAREYEASLTAGAEKDRRNQERRVVAVGELKMCGKFFRATGYRYTGGEAALGPWAKCTRGEGHTLIDGLDSHYGVILTRSEAFDYGLKDIENNPISVPADSAPVIERRQVELETDEVEISKSGAKSSHEALFYHLVSPELIRRAAIRKTVGAKKYGAVQWRKGLNDAAYVRDRYNHLWEHLLKFQQDGNTKDDNLGAMAWALDCLMEAERLCPETFKDVYGWCEYFGDSAAKKHEDMGGK